MNGFSTIFSKVLHCIGLVTIKSEFFFFPKIVPNFCHINLTFMFHHLKVSSVRSADFAITYRSAH